MKKINIKHFVFNHQTWLRGLDFYEIELRFIEGRLEEIIGDNTGIEVAKKVEHFQNQLIIHRDYIDELRHRIKENERQLERELARSADFVDENTSVIHDQLADDYTTEEKMINDLRHEFNRFAAEWM